MDVKQISQEIRQINAEHGFESQGRELFCEKMLLVISEISEALEEFRDGHPLDKIYVDDFKPEGIPVELADAVIRIFDFCEANNIDLEKAIRLKVDYNKTRPYKHGRKL